MSATTPNDGDVMTTAAKVSGARVEIVGLRKAFGPNTVLNGLDVIFEPGELVGLMGPNGAGKSTLIKILDGLYPRDGGQILVNGEPVASLGSRQDVAFIHQDLGLVDELSVLDNLRLGQKPITRFGPFLNGAREWSASETALARLGLTCSPSSLVGDLSPGEKTLVAIARAFDRGATTLVVDEATSTLSPRDARQVVNALQQKAAEGATVLMVTHKLAEVVGSVNRVIVLLDGKIAADESARSLDREAIVRMLLQHEMSPAVEEGATAVGAGQVVVDLKDAYGGRAGPVSLSLRRNEVVGITGLTASGLHDVAYLASGATHPTAGEVEVASGVTRGLVPPDREMQGGFADLTVRENLTLSALPLWTSPAGTLTLGAESRAVSEMIDRLEVVPPNPLGKFGDLSGGNKQKVIFGRVLFENPDLFVLCEPTRGVDIGTRQEIYRLIRRIRDEGAAILVVSSDAEDLFAVADRICVIENGVLSPPRAANDLTLSDLEQVL